MILGDRQRSGHDAVAHRHQAALRANEPLFDDDGPERSQRIDRSDRFVVVDRHDDAFATGEAVLLDDDRSVQAPPPLDRFACRRCCQVTRRRNTERGGQLARVGLRRLQPGQFGGGPEAGDAAAPAFVGDPMGQRRLGADDHQVGSCIGWQIGGDRHLVAVASARPGDRRLAAAGADHQYFHASTPSNASLACASATSMGYRPVKQALQYPSASPLTASPGSTVMARIIPSSDKKANESASM